MPTPQQVPRERRLREPGPDETGQPTTEAGGPRPEPPAKRRKEDRPRRDVLRD